MTCISYFFNVISWANVSRARTTSTPIRYTRQHHLWNHFKSGICRRSWNIVALLKCFQCGAWYASIISSLEQVWPVHSNYWSFSLMLKLPFSPRRACLFQLHFCSQLLLTENSKPVSSISPQTQAAPLHVRGFSPHSLHSCRALVAGHTLLRLGKY